MSYGFASGLRGFVVDSLRVRIVRIEGNCVWVRTADLLDAGTPLVLDRSQVVPEDEAGTVPVYFHKTGLVGLG